MQPKTLVGRSLAGITDQEGFAPEDWPTPDEGALDAPALENYRRRKNAVLLYLSGISHEALRRETGLSARHINHIVRHRCMQPHPDGQIYGWRALIPRLHITAYTRKKKVAADLNGKGTAGALGNLLSLHPEFAVELNRQILKTCGDLALAAVRQPRHALWAWFLKRLRDMGLEAKNEWPFNVQTMGYSALLRYSNKVLSANPEQAARIVGGPQAQQKMASGTGSRRPTFAPYERIEMDAHKLDGRFVVLIPQLDGSFSPRLIHRLWVIVLLDVASRAVIGYHLSMRIEVNKADVIAAIKSALVRWRRRELSFGEQVYFEEAALPSGHHERYVGLCWNETSVDGALAQTCKTVQTKLHDVVGSTLLDPRVGFAQRRSKDDRPFIESFFKTLASRGLHRMSNTTGGTVQGALGRDPARIAVISEFQLEYAAELLDAMIANYNATPHSSLGYRSPLQVLDFHAGLGQLPKRYADPNAVQGLLSVRKLCIVRGGYQHGRRPYVNFLGASYSNEELAQRHDLVGQPIWVVNHLQDDARVALASTKEGLRLGVLRAHPPWHRTPHSLSIRSAILSMVRNRRFALANGADAVSTFMDFVESNCRGKLPIHPSYLELKRLLVQHAQLRSGDETVFAAKVRLGLAHQDPTNRPATPKLPLPPMRKAAN